jgi:hypothetical protein
MTLQGALDAEHRGKVAVACGEFGAVPTRSTIFIAGFSDGRGAGDFRRLERSTETLRRASFRIASRQSRSPLERA